MNRELDYRTDYYSLGVTCFELLTGSLPFQAEDVLGYIHCHLSRAAPDARELNPRVPEGLAQHRGQADGQESRRALPERTRFDRGPRALPEDLAREPHDPRI